MANNESHDMNRHTVLRTISGATAIGSISTLGLGSAAASESDEQGAKELGIVSVENIRGNNKKEIISTFLGDSNLKQIREEWINEGFSEQRNRANVWKTIRVDDLSDYYTVSIPFETPQDEGDAHILWSSLDSIPTIGDYYPNGSSSGETEEVKVVNYHVNDSNIVETETNLGPEDNTSILVRPASAGCRCVNADYDWVCVSQSAFIAGAGIDTCSTCMATPVKTSCAACASALAGAGVSLATCCNSNWTCNPIPNPPTPDDSLIDELSDGADTVSDGINDGVDAVSDGIDSINPL